MVSYTGNRWNLLFDLKHEKVRLKGKEGRQAAEQVREPGHTLALPLAV